MTRGEKRDEEPDQGNIDTSDPQGATSAHSDKVEELTALVKALIEKQDARDKKHDKDQLQQEQRWKTMQRQVQRVQQQQYGRSEHFELDVRGQMDTPFDDGPEETPQELYVHLRDLLNRWLQPGKAYEEKIWEKLILEQFLRMVDPELEGGAPHLC
uniref:SCAN box domain-containing protein n=1 Tax=Knipowitschia caucasica TaxID=637954 RepID=A0AAV2MDK5_KNICA